MIPNLRLSRKSTLRRRLAKLVERDAKSDSSDQDDPPLRREEIYATLSEKVNITTSTILPDLQSRVIPIAPPKKNPLKRKTHPTTVTMVDQVNTTPLQ